VWNRQSYVKDPATGKRVSRLNPQDQWIVTAVPELRIVDDQLWQAVKARQSEITESHVKLTAAIRAHHQRNRMTRARRPKSLLSGLVVCGCCGGPYSLRSVDRFACSSHISNGACSNKRTIARKELEQRVLAGLRDRMMAPEVAAAAMRAYAKESNRLNRERRVNADAWRAELAKVEKQIRGIVEAIKAGMFHASMKAEMDALEARKQELADQLASDPARHARPAAKYLVSLCQEGGGANRGAQPARRPPGSGIGAADTDREDRFDARRQARRDRGDAIWGIGNAH
jgi:site-specific DNA recombinase